MNNKIIKGITAIIVAVAIAAGVCCLGFVSRDGNGDWFKNDNLASWHWGEEADLVKKPSENVGTVDGDKDKDPAGEKIDDSVMLTDLANKGVRLASQRISPDEYEEYGISRQAESALSIEAVISPTTAENQQVMFSLAWNNASSSWATGKKIQDYLTLAQTSDGSKTATLTCKQAFGEQAIITVTSRAVTAVRATAKVDYRKKLLNYKGMFENQSAEVKEWEKGTALHLSKTYEMSIGTLENTVTGSYFTVKASPSLIDELKKSFPGDTSAYSKTYSYTNAMYYTEYANGIFEPVISGESQSTGGGLFSFCAEGWDTDENRIKEAEYNKLMTCLSASAIDLIIVVHIEFANSYPQEITYNVNIVDGNTPRLVKLNSTHYEF